MPRELTTTPDQWVREVVGGNITRARVRAHLSQEQLGDRLGVERTQVSAWERGRRLPCARHLMAIADALGRTHGWFYSEDRV
jgi:transcriptional regulator with XRE-family HTH domain